MLIDDEGKSLGKVGIDQALYLAYQAETDLVLINENQNPPIAKIMDYGKHLYNLKKQVAKQKAKSHDSVIKEVRMGIKIGDHDLAVKVGRIKKFFAAGDKVKVTIQLRGREMIFQDRVRALMDKIKTESGGVSENDVERMGNRFSVVLIKSKN
jgi:translation initiation factor IF-3